MSQPRIVIDTNVVISAFRSKRGASALLMRLVGQSKFTVAVSVPLFLEYEEQLQRKTELSIAEIEIFLSTLYAQVEKHLVGISLRPLLTDRDDDMLAELAVDAKCEFVVSYNKRDLKPVEQLGIQVVTPKEFLQRIGEIV
ncbi:MAG: putative toxin-antitoxin system toxin component, PIN family [Rhizobacter sp.]|nr:putative toxin-antitoxin system toxin component, PIN family [Chlorobiales bacterium]